MNFIIKLILTTTAVLFNSVCLVANENISDTTTPSVITDLGNEFGISLGVLYERERNKVVEPHFKSNNFLSLTAGGYLGSIWFNVRTTNHITWKRGHATYGNNIVDGYFRYFKIVSGLGLGLNWDPNLFFSPNINIMATVNNYYYKQLTSTGAYHSSHHNPGLMIETQWRHKYQTGLNGVISLHKNFIFNNYYNRGSFGLSYSLELIGEILNYE